MVQAGSTPTRKPCAPRLIVQRRTHLLNTIPSPQESLGIRQKVVRRSAVHAPQRAPDRPPDIGIELFDGVRRAAAEEDLVGELWEHGDQGFHRDVVAMCGNVLRGAGIGYDDARRKGLR